MTAMAPILIDDLKPLLDQFDGPGRVLSCYADLAAADGFRPAWHGPLAAQADAAWKELPEDDPVRAEFQRDLRAARAELEAPARTAARWRAVFSAGRRGFFRSVPLDTPVRTEVVYDRSPHLVPLLTAALRRREYLAVHTDSHRARLYAATPGGVRLLDELNSDVPKKQHSAGERWGLGQATIAHHHDEAVHHHIKAVAHRIERAWAEGSYAGLLLFGAHPILEHVRKALPSRLRARVERETPKAWADEPAEVEAAIQDATLRVFAQDEARELDGFWDRLATGRAVAIGPAGVLDALQSGQLGPAGHGYLVLGPDPRETVGRCTGCHALAADAPPACPRCQAPCRLASFWEEVLLMALRHGITVRFVDDPERLAPYGGMVAALPKVRPGDPTGTGARQSAGV
jgi:peptide subunit release factor 1 (eRF1)